MIQHKTATAGVAAFALMLIASSSQAANLVTNGSFEQTSLAAGQSDYLGTNATGWSTSSYSFLVAPGQGDVALVTGGSDSTLKLWSTSNGGLDTLPASSPDGGRYVAADGAFDAGPITQTINGLNSGDQYAVSFYYAGAQQYNWSGANTEAWQVSLGGSTQETPVLSNQSHGFTGWQQETLTFTATSNSEVLSFLAKGTPDGVPPFVLLDGVSLIDVTPPPATTPLPAALFFVAPALAGVFGFSRRKQNKA